MKIDRANMNWLHSMSDEEIYNRMFSIGYLLQTNGHILLLAELRDKVLSPYKVIAKFVYLGYNGHSIFANNQVLVYRPNKSLNFKLGKNVVYLSGNIQKNGGSNKYPSIAHKGAECTLEFVSYGLPFVDSVNGWKIEILSLERI